jgi:lycopene beta-cyclase
LTTTSTLFSTPSDQYEAICDVLILGSGPAARALATLLSSTTSRNPGLNVIVSDQRWDTEWPPNYGVWKDEWEAIVKRFQNEFGVSFEGGKYNYAIDREWPVTDCYFGGSWDIPTQQRMRIDRPYCRVDKLALQKTLSPSSYRVIRGNHIVSKAININLYTPPNSLVHDEFGTTTTLTLRDKESVRVRSKVVVDATGHETKLVLRDVRDPYRPPGFQIAYGAVMQVETTSLADHIGPYDKEAMTLFDYRTDHFDSNDTWYQQASKSPTFMYAMPLYDNYIFFEETSLVARPAVSFQECKDRMYRRLAHHGIRVTNVLEEEFCYIPMGGALPQRSQRVIAMGGAAAMVHPSTGYHLCRCLMGAAQVAQVLRKELIRSNANLDEVAALTYHAIWSPENIRQRNFAVFGGEFLMKQNVQGLRGFFDGFFRLPLPLWGGFLAGWPGLPMNESHESWFARMWFGLTFIIQLPLPVALDMAWNILLYCVSEGVPLPQSVTPLFGEPFSYEHRVNVDGVGDVAAKIEARKMIQESQITKDIPADFSPSANVDSAPTRRETSSSGISLGG